MNTMKKGTVKFFDKARGFGFIKDENGKDIFVHNSALKEDIQENDQVIFDVEEGKKGLNAINVSVA
jgi:CspA family cold shock protein